jgi:2-polyprenyl-6-methoxyphenol hydroxylase-like FAD-dependent oxidoreductase
VVGAGPVGLTMAAELARHGVPCRIFDQKPQPVPGSRAMAMQARTLEIFDDLGIVDQVLRAGHKIHGANIYAEGHRILHFSFDELPTPTRSPSTFPRTRPSGF